jgi:hypothetical protein
VLPATETDKLNVRLQAVQKLRRLGLSGIVAALLESSGAFAMLAAQSLYVSQPLLDAWFSPQGIANMLEDPKETEEFITALREHQ